VSAARCHCVVVAGRQRGRLSPFPLLDILTVRRSPRFPSHRDPFEGRLQRRVVGQEGLHFEIGPRSWTRRSRSASKHYASRVKLPGFRPGKVPLNVIRQRFRQQVLEDVAEKIVNKVVRDGAQGRGLRPVATPRVTDLKIDDNQPMTFKPSSRSCPGRAARIQGAAREVARSEGRGHGRGQGDRPAARRRPIRPRGGGRPGRRPRCARP